MAIACGAGAGASLESLPAELARLVELGYTAAELNPEYLDCIFGGQLHARQAARIGEACQPLAARPGADPPPGKLVFTVHAPAVLDLRHPTRPELHRDILCATVELAGAICARLVVVHFEQRSLSAGREAQLRRGIEVAAEVAAGLNVVLGVENIEVERAERVLELVDAIDSPLVRMTYDFGHDFLAAAHFGYDHLSSVRACAPYAVHTHLSDNFGRFDPARLGDFALYKAIPARNLNVTGLGDVHLPIGWGVLPYAAAIEAFQGARQTPFAGVLLGEHRRAFASADAEVLDRLREIAGCLNGP